MCRPSSGLTVPERVRAAAPRRTSGATGTFSTGPATFPAEMRKLVGASGFTFALSPGSGCQTPSTRWLSTAPLTPWALPVTVNGFPNTAGPPGRVSESEPKAVIHVERSPDAARSVAPETFVVPDAVTTWTLATRPEGPRVSFKRRHGRP